MDIKIQTWIATLVIAVVLVAGTALTGAAFLAQGTEELGKQGEPVLIRDEEVDEVEQYGDIIDQYGQNILLETESESLLDVKEEFDAHLLEERTQLSVKGYEFDRREGFPDFSQKLNFNSLSDSEVQNVLTIDESDLETGELNRETYIIQMVGPRSPEWILELEEMNVDLIGSIHNYGYEARMSPERAEKVEELDYVEWVDLYQPGFKIAPELTMDLDEITEKARVEYDHNQFEQAESFSGTSLDSPIEGVGTSSTGITEAEIEDALERAQPNFPDELVVEIVVLEGMYRSTLGEIGENVDRIRSATEISEGILVTAVIGDHTDLIELAHISDVYRISPYLEPQLHEMSSQILGGGSWHYAPQWGWQDPDPPGREPVTPVEPYRHDDPEWAPAGPLTAQEGYTGEDVLISVSDTGIGDGTTGDAGHPDLTGRVVSGYDWASRSTEPGKYWDSNGHGTAVVGMAASDAYHGTGNQIGDEDLEWTGLADEDYWSEDYYASMGLAPEADIHTSRIADDGGGLIIPDDVHEVPEQAIQQEPELFGQTHSWGMQGARGGYDSGTSAFDAAVRDANRDSEEEEPLVITFSAGNDGNRGQNTVGQPGGTAKNVISVGGTMNYEPSSTFMSPNPSPDMWDVGSLGWTDDNRIKPDVAGPANNVLTTYWYNDPDIDPSYVGIAGTSFSSPAAQGSAAVIADWYEEHPLVEGRPTPAMVRAIMTSTAVDMLEDLDGDGTIDHVPNRFEGWGRIDLTPLVDHDLPMGGPFMMFDRVSQEMEETYLTTGDVEEYSVAPMYPDEPLKIALAWDDKEAPGGASETLQNDLRLKVTSPSGEVYRGNAFSEDGGAESTSGWSYPNTPAMSDFDMTGDGYDDVNNLLSVYLEEPEEGAYEVEVIGHDIPEYANPNIDEPNQDFALSVQNSFLSEDGLLMMDSERYAKNDTVDFTVIDEDMTNQDTTEITINSIKDGGEGEIRDEHNVTLRGEQIGIVRGSIDIGPDFGKGEESDGLKVSHDDQLEARYWDESMEEYKYYYAEVDDEAPIAASDVEVEWYYDERVEEVEDQHNRVTWELSEDDEEEIFEGYRVYRAESVEGEPSEWKHIDTVGSGTTEYIDEEMGKSNYTRYWYEVGAVDDVGNENRTSYPDIEPPAVRLDSPVGGETWTSGYEEEIEWYAATGGLEAEISAEYSTDTGDTWQGIFENMEVDQGEGSYMWTIDDVEDNNPGGLIRVSIQESGENSELGKSHSDSEQILEQSTEPYQVLEPEVSVDDERVKLDWMEPYDGGEPITQYNIYRDGEVISNTTAEEMLFWDHSTHQDEVRDVYEMDGVVYSAGYDNFLIAYDQEDENQLWYRELEGRVFGVYGRDGEVYATTETEGVYAFDAESGDELWSHHHHGYWVSDVQVSSEGIVYSVGGEADVKGELIAYDPEEDTVLWQESDIFSDLLFQLDINETTNQIYTVSYASRPGVSGQLTAYDYDEQEVVWQQSDGPSSAYSVVEDDGVVYSGYYETIIANDAEEGKEIWRTSHHGDEPIWGIDYSEGYIYTGSGDNTIMVSDGETGEKLWRDEIHEDEIYHESRVLAIHRSEDTLYSGGGDGKVIASDPWLDIEATRYIDTDVENFREYTYQVSAVNEVGEGELSPPAKAMPRPSLPDAPRGGDISDYFILTEYEQPEFETINSPQEGDTWYINTTETLDWAVELGDGNLTTLELEYSVDGGETWNFIDEIEDPEAFGDYEWDVPNLVTNEALISFHIEDENNLSAEKQSGEFEIIVPTDPPENLEVDHVSLEEKVVFSDNLSSGEPEEGYETGEDPEGHNDWAVRDHGSYLGEHSWDFGDGKYEKAEEQTEGALSWLISPEIEIPSNTTWTELTFQHWRDFDWRYDGGNMRISIDNGETWKPIEPEGGYPDNISEEFDNPLAGEEGWTNSESWEEVTFDLDEYIGETVQFEWRAGVDSWDTEGSQGWRIDDIEVRAELPYEGEFWHADNRLTWEASPDDGDGEDTVIEYNIYRSDTEEELGEQIASIEADGSEEYRYFDRGTGTDDHVTWYYTVRAGTDEKIEVQPGEPEWHWLYDEEHRYPSDNAIGLNDEGVFYGAIVLDLSDQIGNEINEIAYFDYDEGGDWIQAHVSLDAAGAPTEPWESSSAIYEPEAAGWVELELEEPVEVEEPGQYWVVIEAHDYGSGYFPIGSTDPYVENGGFINIADPFDPGDWEAHDEVGFDETWSIEASTQEPPIAQAESDPITEQEPLAPYPPAEPEHEDEAISPQQHENTELSFTAGHGSLETSMDISFYDASTDELIDDVSGVYANEKVSVEWNQLQKGEYSWYVEIHDGDYLFTSEEYEFMVDDTDPEVDIFMPDDGDILGDSDVMVAWDSHDDWSGIDYYEVRLRDYIPWTMVPGEYDGIEITDVPDDDHTVDVRGIDNAGNQAMDSVEFTVNTAEPVVEIVTPHHGDVFGEGEVKVEWNGYDDHIDMESYELRIENESWIDLGLSESYVLNGLAEGENVIQVRGTDEASNQYVDQVEIIYDPTAPGLDIILPEEGEVFEKDWVEVNWEGFEENSEIEKYEIRLNNQGWIDYEPSESSHTFTGLPDSEHTIHVRATDEAGNQHIETVNFTIDTPEANLEIISPEDRVENLVYDDDLTIEGETDPGSTVYMDGEEIGVDDEGYFEYETSLIKGQNVIEVKAEHPDGYIAETSVYALYLPQIAEMQDNIDELQGQIDENRDAIEDLENMIDQLEADIDDIENEIEGIQSEIEETQSEIEEIQSEIEETQSEIEEIQRQQEEIKGATEQLYSDVVYLETELESLEEDIEELEQRVEELDEKDEEDDDEWWEIPGFTTQLFILGAVVALAFYHKKKQ